jgi:fructose-1,6-bisphosphatase II
VVKELARSLGMELVRATEAAAISAARWLSEANKNAADQRAVGVMRRQLSVVPMQGTVCRLAW